MNKERIPKTCDDCPFHIYHGCKEYVCVATPLVFPMNLANYKGGRKDFCPLKEVPQEPIPEKIRAEIEAMSGNVETKADVLAIIDKYKAESEPQESEDKK